MVVENLRPGAAVEMGLGWEELRSEPELVYCSISGFGQTGDMRPWPAYDHTIKAMRGIAWSGRDDDVPSQDRGFSVDCFTGYVAFAQILGSLVRRERTGEGQYLDVAMLDASLVLLAVGSVRQLITGDALSAAQPIVHDRPTVAPYRTRDGWLWLSANFQNHYVGAVSGDRRTRIAERSAIRRRSGAERALRRAEGRAATRLATCSAVELESRLMQAGCPAALVRTTAELLAMPQLRDRAMLVETTCRVWRRRSHL